MTKKKDRVYNLAVKLQDNIVELTKKTVDLIVEPFTKTKTLDKRYFDERNIKNVFKKYLNHTKEHSIKLNIHKSYNINNEFDPLSGSTNFYIPYQIPGKKLPKNLLDVLAKEYNIFGKPTGFSNKDVLPSIEEEFKEIDEDFHKCCKVLNCSYKCTKNKKTDGIQIIIYAYREEMQDKITKKFNNAHYFWGAKDGKLIKNYNGITKEIHIELILKSKDY